jgi:hypothetical protein
MPVTPGIPGLRRLLTDPATVVIAGLAGLGAIAYAFGLHRTGAGGPLASLLFWLGLIVVLAPVAAHLIAESTARGDRLALCVFAALATYAVKVLHNPSSFGFGDEFIHFAATQQAQATHDAFAASPAVGSQVAIAFPGLHIATLALSDVTTLPLFVSGLVVIGVGRVLLLLGLFVLFEQISGSPRQAGIGALLYMASANFLYFTAQYSYESLSLPLFVVALAIAASLPGTRDGSRRALAICLVILVGAITVTHHLTSYALAATFVALSILAIRPAWRATRARGLAALSIVSATAWYVFIASDTGSYLWYVIDRTLRAVGDAGDQGTRRPFENDSSLQTPVLERVLALVSAALVCVAIIYALRQLWRERRPVSAPAVLLIAASVGFLALFPLKVLPGAWETANRSSDFLFIGVSFVVAALIAHRSATGRARGLTVAIVVAVICGGVIQGWPSPLRLAQSTQVNSGNAPVSAEGLAAANWAKQHLPPGTVYLADESSGRELAVAGVHKVYVGRVIEAPELFESTTLPQWQHDRLVRHHIDYIVLDRRKIASNNLAGYYLQPAGDPGGGFGFFPAGVRAKYERLPRSRTVYDSGDIAIIDIRGLTGSLPACGTVGRRTWSDPFSCLGAHQTVERYAGPDGVARLPQARISVAATRAEHRSTGFLVTVGLLIRNLANVPLRPDPSFSGYRLVVDGTAFDRAHHVTGLRGNVLASTVVPPQRTLQRSVSFRLDEAAAAAFRRHGGTLVLEQGPVGSYSRTETGHVRLGAPSAAGAG